MGRERVLQVPGGRQLERVAHAQLEAGPAPGVVALEHDYVRLTAVLGQPPHPHLGVQRAEPDGVDLQLAIGRLLPPGRERDPDHVLAGDGRGRGRRPLAL